MVEILTGRCIDGEIKGCKEGSFVWHHEDRHRQQGKNPFWINLFEFLSVWFWPFVGFSMVALFDPINFFVEENIKWALFIFWTIWTTLYMSSEVDAWLYSIKIKLKERLAKWYFK